MKGGKCVERGCVCVCRFAEYLHVCVCVCALVCVNVSQSYLQSMAPVFPHTQTRFYHSGPGSTALSAACGTVGLLLSQAWTMSLRTPQ